jgi:hypothetical protein
MLLALNIQYFFSKGNSGWYLLTLYSPPAVIFLPVGCSFLFKINDTKVGQEFIFLMTTLTELMANGRKVGRYLLTIGR